MKANQIRPKHLVDIINGIQYRTRLATLLATKIHRNDKAVTKREFMLRSPHGHYYLQEELRSGNCITPMAFYTARRHWASMPDREMDIHQAFELAPVVDA